VSEEKYFVNVEVM